MTRLTWIGVGLLAVIASAGIAVLQRNAIATLSQELEGLLAAKAEAEQLTAENQAIEASAAQPGDLEALRAAYRERLGLRREVQQLRGRQKEAEGLRAENQRLAAQIRRGVVPGKSISDLEGFVARESWGHAGFASPESTVQTLFWALREGDVQRVAECLRPSERDMLLKQFAEMSEDQRQKMVAESSRLASCKGYRIGERSVIAEDQITLGVQLVADGQILRLPLRRFGQEWKIEQF